MSQPQADWVTDLDIDPKDTRGHYDGTILVHPKVLQVVMGVSMIFIKPTVQ